MMQWFWWLMFGFSFLIPLFMIIFGLVFWFHPPKNINTYYGYRTKRSMKDDKSWLFAHHYFGKFWFYEGLLVLILTIILMSFLYNQSVEQITWVSLSLVFGQSIFMTIPIIFTENELKKRN